MQAVDAHGFVEALEGVLADVVPLVPFANGEIANRRGDEHGAGLAGVAHAAREVHRQTEQVVAVRDGLAGGQSHADA